MPPEYSRKYKERIIATKLIELNSIEILPYKYYEKIERKYIMAKGSTRYAKYMRYSQSYISKGIPISD